MLDHLQSPFHGSGQGLESGLRTAVRANKRQRFAKMPNRPSKPELFVLNVHGLRLCRCRPIGSPHSALARLPQRRSFEIGRFPLGPTIVATRVARTKSAFALSVPRKEAAAPAVSPKRGVGLTIFNARIAT
jgi:hypothetical protein